MMANDHANDEGGGLYGGELLNTYMYNTIFWGNTAGGENGGNQIKAVGDTLLWGCDVQGGEGGIVHDGQLIWATNCIYGDPQFVDPGGSNPDPEDDYALNPNSACVDAGDTGTIPEDSPDLDGDGVFDEPIPFDLRGQPRINRCAVDIGAYEAQVPPLNPPVWDAQDPNLGPKNRYLSFVHDQNPGEQTAVRVTFAEPPPEYWDDLEGRVLWVGEPVEITEASGSDGPEPPPKFWGATLQCGPFYTDWSAYDRVDVYDDAIIPGSTFELDTILSAPECKVTEEYGFSAPTQISTASEWGDVVGDCGVTPCTVPQGVVDFEDITAVVEKFQSDPDAPIKSRADLINSNVTDPKPDRIVDFLDVTFCVDAFRGFPEGNSYPGPNMGDFDCPPYYGDCYADIRVDSNNDGEIDDFDDVVEETSTMFLVVNSDDDDDSGEPDFNEAPVVGEDDLAEIQLTAACDDVLPELAWWSLSWDAGAPIQIWGNEDKSGDLIENGVHYEHPDWPPPESVWLESLDTFDDLEITFTFDAGTGFPRLLPHSPGTYTDTVNAGSTCTPSPEGRYWMVAADYEDVVTGASAEVLSPTAWMEPLCGGGEGTQVRDEAMSAVFVQIAGRTQVPPYPSIPVWGQIGYGIDRPDGFAFYMRRIVSEIKWGPTWPDHWRQYYEYRYVDEGEWHTYKVLHCGDCGDDCEAVTTYLDDCVFDFWHAEIFCNQPFDRAQWYTELMNREDKLCGTESSPCVFFDSKIWLNWDPEPFDAKIESTFHAPGSPGSDAWGIYVPEMPFGNYIEVWDKKPNE